MENEGKKGKVFISDPNIDVTAKQNTVNIAGKMLYRMDMFGTGSYRVDFREIEPQDIVACVEMVRSLLKENLDAMNDDPEFSVMNNMTQEYREALTRSLNELDREFLTPLSQNYALSVFKKNSQALTPSVRLEYRKKDKEKK